MSDKNISTRAVEPIMSNPKTIKTRIVNKHDTEANWNASGVKDTFVPKQGEMVVYDIDSTHISERIKIGDGTTAVGSLPFIGDVTAAGSNDFTGYNSFSKHVNLKYGPEGYIDFGNELKFWGNCVTKTTDNTQTYSLLFPSNKTGLHTFAMLDDLPVANPTETGTATLTKLKVGDTVYSLPSGGGSGDVTAAGDNTFTGTNKFSKQTSFGDYNTSASNNAIDTYGAIQFYNGAFNCGKLVTDNTDNKNLTYKYGDTVAIFPKKSGTFALTSDIPDTSNFAELDGNNIFTNTNDFCYTNTSVNLKNTIRLEPSSGKLYVGAGGSSSTNLGSYICIESSNISRKSVIGTVYNYNLPNTSDTLACFPIGYIYISTNTTSPASMFGGTWERIKDVFLLAAGDTYTAGGTGGSANAVVVSHSGHLIANSGSGWLEYGDLKGYYLDKDKLTQFGTLGRGWNVRGGNEVYPAGADSGESGIGKNMPPYLTVYMWKRTA